MKSSYIMFHVIVGLYVVGGAHWGYWGALDQIWATMGRITHGAAFPLRRLGKAVPTTSTTTLPSPRASRCCIDPEHWPGLCTNGKKQSPIDIVRENILKKDLRPLEFLKYEHAATGVVANNGHTVEIEFSEDTFLLEGGELPATYVLDHIHFHWPSEHTVDGVRDAFETHFVHYNNKYADLKAASQQETGIAVVSTLYKLSDSDNMDLAPIVKATKLVSQWGGPGSSKPKPVPLKSKLFPRQLLPKKDNTYYHYNGSLTTPECLETVMWYVLAGKRTLSAQQLRVFESIETDNGTLAFNYRPTQVVGNRKVFYHLDEYSSVAMPTSNLFITMFSILFIKLLCS